MENYIQQMKIFNSSCQSEGKAKEKRGKMIPLACGNYRRLAAPKSRIRPLTDPRDPSCTKCYSASSSKSLRRQGKVDGAFTNQIAPMYSTKTSFRDQNQLRLVGQNQLVFWRPQGRREQAR
ncbi:hypothetical protein TWF569_009311 [Orbilia oligospora]|uniref:Uncharacterized protein n=1 Tax=Orbilia oligospora TaxID=2813651 RepID=A0A7C8J7Q8_ORBOL|nr:hypothetical protein TWF102_011558 [Orbilia oligospora]KAF3094593.1 hypothetical protein TWF706_008430 [Orbilia oligospora]KAF3096505.1 hypothetical protein TWF103_009839 [Orbilia oligospora]KAF3136036.1 hypothetical protein TWF594_008008 [Orbilia oligospora]KAF3137032.1 hypothetical protein TWF569_009311 [Orbilia oligospora]